MWAEWVGASSWWSCQFFAAYMSGRFRCIALWRRCITSRLYSLLVGWLCCTFSWIKETGQRYLHIAANLSYSFELWWWRMLSLGRLELGFRVVTTKILPHYQWWWSLWSLDRGFYCPACPERFPCRVASVALPVPWKRISLILSTCINPQLKCNSLILCSFSLRENISWNVTRQYSMTFHRIFSINFSFRFVNYLPERAWLSTEARLCLK